MIRAPRAGVLPGDDVTAVGGVQLPKGRLVEADPDFASKATPGGPLLWVSVDPVDDVATLADKLVMRFADTGLWPLALDSLDDGNDARPWSDGELDPGSSSAPDVHSTRDVLAKWWSDVVPEGDEEGLEALAPFNEEFPGQAPGVGSGEGDRVAFGDLEISGRLGLVAVTRPADIVATIGWMGPVNHFSDMGMLSALLRSWEDRFGAYLVGVGFDTLTLAVRRPPSDIETATAIAAEHFAACPDNINQGAGSIEAYAETLVDSPVWMFWWD
jgi:hypothetical protein